MTSYEKKTTTVYMHVFSHYEETFDDKIRVVDRAFDNKDDAIEYKESVGCDLIYESVPFDIPDYWEITV